VNIIILANLVEDAAVSIQRQLQKYLSVLLVDLWQIATIMRPGIILYHLDECGGEPLTNGQVLQWMKIDEEEKEQSYYEKMKKIQ